MKALAIHGKSGLVKPQFTPPSLLLIFMACSTGTSLFAALWWNAALHLHNSYRSESHRMTLSQS